MNSLFGMGAVTSSLDYCFACATTNCHHMFQGLAAQQQQQMSSSAYENYLQYQSLLLSGGSPLAQAAQQPRPFPFTRNKKLLLLRK